MSLVPVIAIVGRPNVGKSTLFNCLTKSRDALVVDEPGITRDRLYGVWHGSERAVIIVDTGGLASTSDEITRLISEQADRAIEESDLVLFTVDAKEGASGSEPDIAERIRRTGKPVIVVANKVDGLDAPTAMAEFYALGFGHPQPIAAAHGRGIRALMERALEQLPAAAGATESLATHREETAVCIIGRPNVGKSTLVNRLAGEQRVVAHDVPGTTRDSVRVPFERDGRAYVLIDTAGIRRRARVDEAVEKLSVIKSLQALAAANVAVLLVDARDAFTDQDARLLGHVLESGRALVIGVNKWDGLEPEQRESVRQTLDRKLAFADFARLHFISALKGSGLSQLLRSVDRAREAAFRKLPTPLLTRVLSEAVERTPPPLVRGRRIKLRYAHQGGVNPPRIVVHGNQTDAVPEHYRRYLIRTFRNALKLDGTPVAVMFRSGTNPFEGRRNKLTRRQLKRRQRIRGNRK